MYLIESLLVRAQGRHRAVIACTGGVGFHLTNEVIIDGKIDMSADSAAADRHAKLVSRTRLTIEVMYRLITRLLIILPRHPSTTSQLLCSDKSYGGHLTTPLPVKMRRY